MRIKGQDLRSVRPAVAKITASVVASSSCTIVGTFMGHVSACKTVAIRKRSKGCRSPRCILDVCTFGLLLGIVRKR